jgi:stage V sporulation protein B
VLIIDHLQLVIREYPGQPVENRSAEPRLRFSKGGNTLSEIKKQSYLKGAAILAATAIAAKIISGLYKIPLFSLLDDNSAGYYQVAYNVYMFLAAITTAGIPVALSRLVSAASATGNKRLIKRYFSIALPAFTLVGIVIMVLIFFFADNLAQALNNAKAAAGIRILAPAVFFGCIIAVYRGFMQGHGNMVPTALTQMIEVICKAVFGLLIAWYLISNGFDNTTVSAGAIAGVSVGLGLGIPVLVYFKRKTDRQLRLAPEAGSRNIGSSLTILARIFKVSIPITMGSVFISLMTNIDTAIVNNRLVSGAGFPKAEAEALYGVYAKGLSLLNLSSALIVPVTVSIIPAIAAAIANNRQREAKEITESSIKITNIVAMPAGIGLTVLAHPIYTVLLGSSEIGPRLLAIFGVASYFVCMQLMTTAILQANSLEKTPILSYLLGGLIQIAIDYYLVGIKEINIVGSPVGTLCCYLSITVLNFIFIVRKVRNKPNFVKVFLKPALCTAVMGVAAWAVYELAAKLGAASLGTGRLPTAAYMFLAIAVAVAVYGILIIATKTVTMEDMKFVPRGEKLAKILKIK